MTVQGLERALNGLMLEHNMQQSRLAPATVATHRRPDWRALSRSALDAAYNNVAAVSDSNAWLARWTERSQALRSRQPELLDLRYGDRERNRIDVFRSNPERSQDETAPLFVFIHGGYWQRNSKEVFSCMAEGLLAHGVDVALPGYTLAPDASLTEIVSEIRSSIRWLREHGPHLGIANSRLIISGWSAGGHLTASCMDMPEVDAGLAISGIFELEPIANGQLNDALGLTEAEVAALSPLRHIPARAGPLDIVWGLDELPELQRQSCDFARAWRDAGHAGAAAPLTDVNHFTILEELARPDGAIAAMAARLAKAHASQGAATRCNAHVSQAAN